MVSEIVPEKRHKTRAFLLLPMCFNVGVIIGPLLTGFMADPVHTLPGIFGPGSLFGGENGVQWLERFPYALPNLFCFSILMSAFFLVILGLDETHPHLRHRPDAGRRLGKILLRIILRRKTNGHLYDSINIEDSSEPLINNNGDQESGESQRPAKAYNKTRPPFRAVLTKNVCLNMLQRFLQSIHVSAFNSILFSLLPTPKADSKDFHLPFRFTGGLGLSSERMGLANTIIGTIGIPLQLFVYPRLIGRLGVKDSYRAFLPLSIVAYFVLPYLALLPDNSALIWTCLSVVLSLQVLSRTFVNPATLMLINDSAPSPDLLVFNQPIMAQQYRLKVVIGGASGETGTSIVNALLASPDQFEVTALVRPESASKSVYEDLAKRNVAIKPVDFKDIKAVTPLLVGADVVISCLTLLQKAEEDALIDASHAAGVGRFVPSFFATVCPRGILLLRDMKEELLDKCKRLYLPYTVIDVGWWYQSSLPAVPSGKLDAKLGVPDMIIGADGNVPYAATDLADIGKYVARIIADPRTLNKMVLAYGEVTTQNKVWGYVEELTGEKIPKKYLSKKEAEDTIAAVKKGIAENPSDFSLQLQLAMTGYRYTWAIRGDNTPDHAKYLGYLDAKERYPDVQCKSIREFAKEVIEGSRSAALYQGRPDHPLNMKRG
ncbi:hypothetical protein IL306_004709 [Fusarium sp. DS 682]|nr:hypothetical protein IL306_004709 [Fusarium sp. DS 682]